MKRLAYIGYVSLLVVVLTYSPGAFGASQRPKDTENKESKQTVVETGDLVTVQYSSKEPGGEVLERNSLRFRVGMGTAYRGLEKAVLGMQPGETKTIDVSAAEGYGEVVAKKVVNIPRSRSIPRHKKLSVAQFKRSAKGQPVVGKKYALRGVPWPITVLQAENEWVLVDLVPEQETQIPALIGYARVTYDDESITTTIVTEAKVGDRVTTNKGQRAKVVALDDQNITLDFNHPLAGKRVRFDFTVTELTKQPKVTIPGLQKWESIEGLSVEELQQKYRALLTFAKPYIVREGIKELVVPTGVPDIYGKELGVEFSPDKADTMIAILRKFEAEKLNQEQLDAYIRIGMRTACEYCCQVKTLVRKDGERACGCAHSYAMRGLAKYLLLHHGDQFSEDQILAEINRWKALFFPKQSIQKVIATGQGTGAFDLSVLQEMPNMVGGC
jgi:FKBP-type peptidyl-prolyl cis-trans isomerase 2